MSGLADGGGELRPMEPQPVDLAAVQADDALLDALNGPTNPPEGDPVERALMAWRREIDTEPTTPLVDTDTARAIVARARGPQHRRRVLRIPRWARRIHAWLGGYFWSSCPSCERPFGGHEVLPGPHYGSIPTGPDTARTICPACTGRGVGCRAHAQLRGTYHGRCEFAPPPPTDRSRT